MNINEVCAFLKDYNGKDLYFMEICGTHTASVCENGIDNLISEKIHLVSGPGCPVCVTVCEYIDRLVELSEIKNNVIVSFGDMLRVPGSKCSLNDARAKGADIRMVYSPLELIEIASGEPNKNFIFAAVGFETTTPVYAELIDAALEQSIKNIRLLTSLKTMPAAVDKLCAMNKKISGFLAPGHVCAITGANAFLPLAEKYNMPFVVSGFTAEEIICSIYALVMLQGKGVVKNLYKRAVKDERNEKAYRLTDKYFEPCKASWRGFGEIEGSGRALKKEYELFDAQSKRITKDSKMNRLCLCSDIVLGMAAPKDCPLFRKICSPENPQGACMVSTEGSCFNYFVNNRG